LGGGESSAGIKEDRANGSGDKPVKKDSAAGNLEAGRPKQSKPSRRTTSLLNLFMPNSQGMSVVDVSFYRAGIFLIFITQVTFVYSTFLSGLEPYWQGSRAKFFVVTVRVLIFFAFGVCNQLIL
jgi:hypothetical protein